MRRLISVLASAGIAAGIVACASGGGDSGGNTRANPDPAASVTDQWAANGGDHYEQRHSPLTQINDTNVKQLGLAWSADPSIPYATPVDHRCSAAVPGGLRGIREGCRQGEAARIELNRAPGRGGKGSAECR